VLPVPGQKGHGARQVPGRKGHETQKEVG